MDDSIQVILGFVLYILYVLVPLLPAIIIYKMFPKTSVGVKGLLGNLKINATGAFAAYIITVVMGHFIIENNQGMINNMKNTSWEISSKIVLTDADGNKINVSDKNLRDALQIKTTPDWGVKTNSEVVFIAHSRGELPRVIFSYGRNFESKMVNLEDDSLNRDESSRKINIGTVFLKSSAGKSPYPFRPSQPGIVSVDSSNSPIVADAGLPIPIGSGPPTNNEPTNINN